MWKAGIGGVFSIFILGLCVWMHRFYARLRDVETVGDVNLGRRFRNVTLRDGQNIICVIATSTTEVDFIRPYMHLDPMITDSVQCLFEVVKDHCVT